MGEKILSWEVAIDTDLFLRLGAALGVGLLVGVERAWRQRDDREGGRTAGVRTFGLIGLLGGICGALSGESYAPWLAGLAILSVAFGAFSYREGVAENNFSVTNLVAAMLVYSLGVMALHGDLAVTAAAGVATAALLASREKLHRTVERLTWVELRSALLLAAMTALVLPVLPNHPVDPLGAINPAKIWKFMILTAGISYLGYIALKIGGPEKGPPLAGLAGGLASSTATTLALSRLSKKVDDNLGLAAGVSFAAMVSVVRATFLAGVVAPPLLAELAPASGAAAAVFGVGGLLALFRRKPGVKASNEVSVPFELPAVFAFGALLAVIMLLSAWLSKGAGAAGIFALAAISGLVDVDAITLSQARSASEGGSLSIAAAAILIALAANAVQRGLMAWSIGARPFAVRFCIVSGLALVAGGAGLIAARFI